MNVLDTYSYAVSNSEFFKKAIYVFISIIYLCLFYLFIYSFICLFFFLQKCIIMHSANWVGQSTSHINVKTIFQFTNVVLLP